MLECTAEYSIEQERNKLPISLLAKHYQTTIDADT